LLLFCDVIEEVAHVDHVTEVFDRVKHWLLHHLLLIDAVIVIELLLPIVDLLLNSFAIHAVLRKVSVT